jgi:hypothetical protein
MTDSDYKKLKIDLEEIGVILSREKAIYTNTDLVKHSKIKRLMQTLEKVQKDYQQERYTGTKAIPRLEFTQLSIDEDFTKIKSEIVN